MPAAAVTGPDLTALSHNLGFCAYYVSIISQPTTMISALRRADDFAGRSTAQYFVIQSHV